MEENAKKIRKFIISVTKQRKLLIDNHKSKLNEIKAWQDIMFINNILGAYPYMFSKKIAKFFIKHQNKILHLIPGEGSADHAARLKEFDEIKKLCGSLMDEV